MPRAARPRVATQRSVRLLIATRKGLWTLTSDASRRSWKLSAPSFLGHIVHHAMRDPRRLPRRYRKSGRKTPKAE